MSQPKFSVGEPVYVCPGAGGKYEAVVERVKHRDEWHNITSGELDGSGYGYHISSSLPDGGYPWKESSLRKRYPPADEDFMEDLKGLMNPKKETA